MASGLLTLLLLNSDIRPNDTIGLKINNKIANCYVRSAQSAALQIIMPACRKIYAVESSEFGFHAAHYEIASDTSISELDAVQLFTELNRATAYMAAIMNKVFNSDTKCSKDTPEALKKISGSCTAQHMNLGTLVKSREFNHLWKNPPLKIIKDDDWRLLVGER